MFRVELLVRSWESIKYNIFYSDQKIQDILSKHLIKTVCSEITNEMLRFISSEQMINLAENNLTIEVFCFNDFFNSMYYVLKMTTFFKGKVENNTKIERASQAKIY
jgi:hypothetical protein